MAPPGTPERDAPGPPAPDLSPEARRRAAIAHLRSLAEQQERGSSSTRAGPFARLRRAIGPDSRIFAVVKRVVVGTYTDGFIHAGNLAYMSVLALFPFFITGAAIFSLFGEQSERAAAINAILVALPPVVGEVIGPVARNVVQARTGWLLWVGGLVGLWTVGSLIETVRDILRRAYGTQATRAFWKYRLLSTGMIVVAVVLLMLSLIAQVMIGTAQQVIQAYMPGFSGDLGSLSWSRILPAFALFGSLYVLFYTLTPAIYRQRRYPKWPGALLVTTWWLGVTLVLPPLLHWVFHYNATYGSLAGIMIALFFFWLVGLGMVMGAELNAALAETPEEEEDHLGTFDHEQRIRDLREVEQQNEEEAGQ